MPAAQGKTLLVLRHAKSDWQDPDISDHERPLNARGRRDAQRLGEFVRDEHPMLDHIVTSTATRARQTVELMVAASGYEGQVTATSAFYLAGLEKYLATVRTLPAAYRLVMVVGHNPGLEELVRQLSRTAITLSTATLVNIALPITEWHTLDEGTVGDVRGVWRPRDVPGS